MWHTTYLSTLERILPNEDKKKEREERWVMIGFVKSITTGLACQCKGSNTPESDGP